MALGQEQREVRKRVTVLFCDLTGSTALGERLDPEALRATMRRYYEEARTILERHGGTVEKFIGDAVMAVFGVPGARGRRASGSPGGVELRSGGRLDPEARIGVNTGEVVAARARRWSSATRSTSRHGWSRRRLAGVLLGERRPRLVRDAVRVEPFELSLKGKSAPVTAYRLLTWTPRRPASPATLDRRWSVATRARSAARRLRCGVVAQRASCSR